MPFQNRTEAGVALAGALAEYAGQPVVVYALPRGGVVLGVEVARRLRAPLDLLITRKIGHPLLAEYAIAAVTESGAMVSNQAEIARVAPAWLEREAARQVAEARRRHRVYLGASPAPAVENQTAIVVDDGLATGLSMKAAIGELRQRRPAHIVVAVPVAAPATLKEIAGLVDRAMALETPQDFEAIGAFYRDFEPVGDDEVVALLHGLGHAGQDRGAA